MPGDGTSGQMGLRTALAIMGSPYVPCELGEHDGACCPVCFYLFPNLQPGALCPRCTEDDAVRTGRVRVLAPVKFRPSKPWNLGAGPSSASTSQ